MLLSIHVAIVKCNTSHSNILSEHSAQVSWIHMYFLIAIGWRLNWWMTIQKHSIGSASSTTNWGRKKTPWGIYNPYNYSRSKEKKWHSCSVPSRPNESTCKTAIPCTENGNWTGRNAAMGKRQSMQSTIPIIASMKKTPEESKEHCLGRAIAFGGDRGRLTVQARSTLESWLWSQSSHDYRIPSESKSSSNTLPQKTLQDHGNYRF